MRLLNTLTALTHTAVSTAVKATIHPIDTTFEAVGLVKETAGAGVGLVRNRISALPPQEQLASEESTELKSAHHMTTAEDVVDEVKEGVDDVTEQAGDAAKVVTAKAAEQAEVVKDKTADKADAAKLSVQDEKHEPPRKPVKKPVAEKPAPERTPAKKAAPEKAATEEPAAQPVDEDPRDHLPGPDLAPYIPPAVDELPEPIVIVAE